MCITHMNGQYMDLTCHDIDGLRMVQITMSDTRDINLQGESDIYDWDHLYKGVSDICEVERNFKVATNRRRM